MAPRWSIPLVAGLAAPFGLYISFILLGSIPLFQRQYVRLSGTLIRGPYTSAAGEMLTSLLPVSYTRTSSIRSFGMTSISQNTGGSQAYLRNEDRLQAQPAGFAQDVTTTESFKMLREDPDARLVVYFHGNAGHVAQAIRPDSYHALTDNSNNHVLAIDYRGFGKSTGIPSESGLINDGAAAVDWAMKVAKVPASQIVILGQSLGTAVTSGVAEHFAMQGVEFAGVIMVASFSNLPTLLSRYSAAGFIPVLSPVRAIPPLMRFFQGFVVDKWQSDARLATLVGLTRTRLRLTLIHAKNDVEIPCSEDDALFRAAAGSVIGTDLDEEDFAKWKEERTVLRDDGTFVATVKSSQPDIVIREELVPYGGHNDVMMSSSVILAVMRSFGLESTKAS
ncbi:Abhydrolase domain protein [Apiospora kogelbergensis]|uniref:Abhydrolase domain protein n=1 Tax=Apiospora kogelbergensis TaxID=1337665 RepID=A0AAW0RE57_9PEZI